MTSREANADLLAEIAALRHRVASLTRENTELQERQAATADILRVISSSPTEVQPVFNAIVESATRLSGAGVGHLFRFDGELLHLVARHNSSPDYDELLARRYPMAPSRGQVSGRAIQSRTVVQIPDVLADSEYLPDLALAGNWRSRLGVPLLREGSPIGVIVINRTEPGLFASSHIELLRTFAAQAVIAIENVRLFTELQEKNKALTRAHAQVTETLEQQTATSEILRVISQSPTDVQPVFDAIAAKAQDLCRAKAGIVFTLDGEWVHVGAAQSLSAEAVESLWQTYPMTLSRGGATARAILTRTIVYIPDISEDPEYGHHALAKAADALSVLAVPMLHDGKPIGTIAVTGVHAGAFSQSQIQLLQTFADQAVIAIENVRLFKELQARNRQLTEALDQQTATGQILRVISSSPTDIQPVFDCIAESAVRLCRGMYAGVVRVDGEFVDLVAHYNFSSEALALYARSYPQRLSRENPTAHAILDRKIVEVPDIDQETGYSAATQERAHALGYRAIVVVPMLHGDIPIGAIGVSRREPGRFPEDHIQLLKTFADQAVIAIENVRLFKELEAANRELAAASQHKSEFLANMSHELRTPLNAIIGFSEVLSEKMFGELNEKQEEYSKDIHASGQHLLSLINDILELSKIEAGRMELELSDFHLPTALDSALTLVRERAGRRGIALHLAVDERLGQILGDERKIRQVVLNLLSNAVKFTPEGGRIDVQAEPRDGSVEVSVSDTGVGIAPEDQETVFEEFRQVGTADKEVEGTGLGLTLCRKFVELHGGKIWVTSQVGVGSTFTFTIPIRRGE